MAATKQRNHLGAGIILAAIMMVMQVIIHVQGRGANQYLFLSTLLPLLVGIPLFTWLEATRTPFAPSFSSQLSFGLKTTSIVILLMVIFVVVFFKGFPQFKDRLLEARLDLSEARGIKLDDESLSQDLADWDRHFLQRIITIVFITHMFAGGLASAIGALISPKRS